ncbi:hypothetical protein [Luteipulveratus halotolerans]|uniref:hypothetical protein n=1 Tax=Luteipulveratus halotolerans TaxID=1631356 RepID=UPI000681188C|nr:hypothetical protein [Luteipulveratus halotolerans]
MDAKWWWLIAAVIVILLLLLLLPMLRKRKANAQRAEAAELRQDAQGRAPRVQAREAEADQVSAAAQQTRAEADRKEAEARQLEAEAAERQRLADREREAHDQRLRKADEIDPDVETDDHGRRVGGPGPDRDHRTGRDERAYDQNSPVTDDRAYDQQRPVTDDRGFVEGERAEGGRGATPATGGPTDRPLAADGRPQFADEAEEREWLRRNPPRHDRER